MAVQSSATADSIPRDSAAAAPGASRASWRAAVVMALLVSVVPAILWPGDAPWIWDEPKEIGLALTANQEWRPAVHALFGGFALPYGAFGLHIYQVWLLFTHDPRALVVLHGLACTVPTALGLLWLARTLGLSPWFAVAVLASPNISWFEARRLWQPSFCVPLGTIAMAAYAAFLRGRARKWLLLAIACTIAPLFVHLQTLPLSLAIFGHLLWRQRDALQRHIRGVLIVLGSFYILNALYIKMVVVILIRSFAQFVHEGHNSKTDAAQAWWGPLVGGRLFSGWDWVGMPEMHRFADFWNLSLLTKFTLFLRYTTTLSCPLVWLGIGVAIWQFSKSAMTYGVGGSDIGETPRSRQWVRDTILNVTLGGLAIQMVLWVVMRLAPTHHYFFGTFALHVIFAWIGVEALARVKLRGAVTALYGLAGLTLTCMWISNIHRDSWPTNISPVLDEQVALVRMLNDYTDLTAYTEVEVYRDRPFVLQELRRLIPPKPNQARLRSGRLFIRYRKGPNGPTNRIELVELAPGAAIPKEAKQIVIVPP